MSKGSYLSEQQHQLSLLIQDTGDIKSEISNERKPKKRKSDCDVWSTSQKKGKPGISEMMDSDSDTDNSDTYVNEDDNTNNSNSSNEDGRDSSTSLNEFASDAELGSLDAADRDRDAVSVHDNRTSSDMDNSNDGDEEDNLLRFVHLNT